MAIPENDSEEPVKSDPPEMFGFVSAFLKSEIPSGSHLQENAGGLQEEDAPPERYGWRSFQSPDRYYPESGQQHPFVKIQ